jgi:hypothetical protein
MLQTQTSKVTYPTELLDRSLIWTFQITAGTLSEIVASCVPVDPGEGYLLAPYEQTGSVTHFP